MNKIVQVFLKWLPGYMYCDGQLKSTGAALAPTMHVNPKNGEIRYYCRPIFSDGFQVGMFIRRQGLIDAVTRGDV
jgi:hypothetical protein